MSRKPNGSSGTTGSDAHGKDSVVSAAAALDALGFLASSLEIDGKPLQSLHCLLAALGLKPLPDAEAKARCQIGRLLLAHTNNLLEAKDHLQRAVS